MDKAKEIDLQLSAARAVLPEGYAVVPLKPTPEMSDAGWMVEQNQNTAWRVICHEVWAAMVQAAK